MQIQFIILKLNLITIYCLTKKRGNINQCMNITGSANFKIPDMWGKVARNELQMHKIDLEWQMNVTDATSESSSTNYVKVLQWTEANGMGITNSCIPSIILHWIISEIWVLSEILDCFTPASRARILLLFICKGGVPMVSCGDFQKCFMLWVHSCWDNGGFDADCALNLLSVCAIKMMKNGRSCIV